MIEKKLLLGISFVVVVIILCVNQKYGFFNTENYVGIKMRSKTSNLETKKCLPIKETNGMNVLEYNRKNHNFIHSFIRINDKKIKIFVHGSDDIISQQLIKNGIWEREWLSQLLKFMALFPKIQLLDFGSNIGVYTLTVAGHGYKVVAVDANSNNTDRLIQSVIENNFQRNVVVVLNGLSNVRREFSMYYVKNNVGSQALINDKHGSYKIKSIFVDDLLPLVDENQKVVIKMDIERSEINAIRMAGGLFAKRHVVALFMEWIYIREHSDIDVLIDFLINRNFRPYKDFFSVIELNRSTYKSWPQEVVWRNIS